MPPKGTLLLSERDDAALIHEIRAAAAMIRQHLTGLPTGTFQDNWLVRDAVSMRLVVIGEAASRLSDEVRASLPEVNWRGIIALRHLLSHDYGSADPDILWMIASERLVELERALSTIRLRNLD